MNRALAPAVIFCTILIFAPFVEATVIFGLTDDLRGGRRWDAAHRTVDLVGGPVERSLEGGLRWNVEGGSIAAFRDQFDWQGEAPSVAVFEATIHASFEAWRAVDPLIGAPAPFHFVHDPTTPVAPDSAGAEIDLFAASTGQGPAITGGLTFANFVGGNVTLTSGTTGYPGQVMSGTDIRLNNESDGNNRTEWTIPLFRTVLTHEIGHALGLGDTDLNGHRFLDDNYDGTSPETAAATLTNGFSHLVDPFDPSNSPLYIVDVPDTEFGIEASGVHLLMESSIDALQTGFLTPDDFAGRQFLYPAIAVPEPSTMFLAATAAAALICFGRRASPFPTTKIKSLEPTSTG